ncbi:MAG: hypothetical protein ACK526_23410 [Planctomyces sp.]|jgi:hypothetical protein
MTHMHPCVFHFSCENDADAGHFGGRGKLKCDLAVTDAPTTSASTFNENIFRLNASKRKIVRSTCQTEELALLAGQRHVRRAECP